MDPHWLNFLRNGIGHGYTVLEKVYLLREIWDYAKIMEVMSPKFLSDSCEDASKFGSLKASEINKKLREYTRDMREILDKSIAEFPMDVRKGPGKLDIDAKFPATIEADTVQVVNDQDPLVESVDLDTSIAEKEGVGQQLGGGGGQKFPKHNRSDRFSDGENESEDKLPPLPCLPFFEGYDFDEPNLMDETDYMLDSINMDSTTSSDLMGLSGEEELEDSDAIVTELPDKIMEIIQIVANLPAYRFPEEIGSKLLDREATLAQRAFLRDSPARH